MFRFSGRWGASGQPLAPEIDAGWSLGMVGTVFDAPVGLPTDLLPILDRETTPSIDITSQKCLRDARRSIPETSEK